MALLCPPRQLYTCRCVSRSFDQMDHSSSVRRRFAATEHCPMVHSWIPNTSILRRASASLTHRHRRLVIRAGYGIFYTQDIGNAYFDMARNIAGRVTYTNTDSASGIFGNSSLTWANATPGAGGGAIANLPSDHRVRERGQPQDQLHPAVSAQHPAAGWTGLVVRGRDTKVR